MKKSKAKKTRRRRPKPQTSQFDALVNTYRSFDSDLLWATLYAVASSPSARHRATSAGVALAASLRADHAPSTHQTNSIPDLQTLIDDAAESKGSGRMHEDYIPLDPTNVATVRVGDELLRYVPGLTERPIADLSRALRLASVLDERLVRRHKFGIANVVRVSLRYVDYCLDTLLAQWEAAPNLKLGDEIRLPENELAAAHRLTSSDPLEHLKLDRADLRALEWMTSSASSAKFEHENLASPFGRTLRFRRAKSELQDRWLPPTYVPEVLAYAVSELVDGLTRDNRAMRALRAFHLDEARRALWRFSPALIEAPPRPLEEIRPLRGNEIQWVVPVGGKEHIAVSIISTIDRPQAHPSSAACVTLSDRVRNRVDEDGPLTARMPSGTIKLLPGAVVIPLVIVAGTSHLVVPQVPGQATLALEDLTWIAQTATSDHDLYRFVRDLSSPDFPPSVGWEAINYWGAWKDNDKTFFKGGIRPTFMSFAPHAGNAEWERTVALTPLEIALYGTGLPPVREAELVDIASDNVASVSFSHFEPEYDFRRGLHHAPDRIGWSLSFITPPIAIVRSDPAWADGDEHRFLFDVCGGLIFAFDAIGESWRRAHEGLDISGYQLWLQSAKGGDDQAGEAVSPSTLPIQAGNRLRVANWDIDLEGFLQRAEGDPHAANSLTMGALEGLLKYGGADRETAKEVGKEWLTGRPFLILETERARTKLNYLPRPWRLDPSDASAVTAVFARHLHASKVEPGQYRGTGANVLIREYLAPASLKTLTDRIALHDRAAIIATGMEQLNRVRDQDRAEQGNLARVSRHLRTEWNPAGRAVELAGAVFNLRQCNEIIVEAALRAKCDSGPREPIAAQSWSALLAAADAYRTVTILSERLHYRVDPVTISISPGYEFSLEDDEQPPHGFWVLEHESLNAAWASLRLQPEVDESETELQEPNDAVNLAMLDAFGASALDLFRTLIALAQWESFDKARSIAFASPEEILDWVCEEVGADNDEKRSRLRQALQLLTLSAEVLRSSSWEPWRTRTRRHRLLVQPLVRRSDGTILIAPQYLLATLNAYYNHLAQGQLPWTGDVPHELDKALAKRREERNKSFESDLAQKLQELGFKVISRVKPGDHRRLSVPAISTEIDLVCGRDGDPNIWLIEAKDPASVHGHAETARQLRTFYEDSNRNGRLKPCYATQLGRKESELSPFIDRIAQKLGVKPPDQGDHALQTRFVTRSLTPAGFAASRPYEVLTASQLFAVLKNS